MFDFLEDRLFNQKKIKQWIKEGKAPPEGKIYYWETGGDTFLPLVENKYDLRWVNIINRPETVILGQSIVGDYLKSTYDLCEFRFIGFHMVPLMNTNLIKLKKADPDLNFFCMSAVRQDRSHRQRFKDFLESNHLDRLGLCRFQSGDQSMISFSDLEPFYPSKMLEDGFLPILPSVGMYNRTRYEVVIETFGFDPADDTFDMSEKIFKPIIMKHPFMVASTIGYLDNMKKLGFRTFSKYIDESYDTELSEGKKFEIIGKNISFLNQQDKNYYEGIEEICQYNYNLFIELQKEYGHNLQIQIDRIKNES